VSGKSERLWRVVLVGGHTRSIGKTQLVCDIIAAFPKVDWIAGKITQYGHGVCAQNGENCDCAPAEHAAAFDWESNSTTGTDSARFLAAGARKSFWLRTKQGFLAEGLPLLRESLSQLPPDSAEQKTALIFESNALMQFLTPSLYFPVLDPLKDDFKESAQAALDRASALVFRASAPESGPPAPIWMRVPQKLLKEKPNVLQQEGEELPEPIWALVYRVLDSEPTIRI
jgi:hypothetical protein